MGGGNNVGSSDAGIVPVTTKTIISVEPPPSLAPVKHRGGNSGIHSLFPSKRSNHHNISDSSSSNSRKGSPESVKYYPSNRERIPSRLHSFTTTTQGGGRSVELPSTPIERRSIRSSTTSTPNQRLSSNFSSPSSTETLDSLKYSTTTPPSNRKSTRRINSFPLKKIRGNPESAYLSASHRSIKLPTPTP